METITISGIVSCKFYGTDDEEMISVAFSLKDEHGGILIQWPDRILAMGDEASLNGIKVEIPTALSFE